MCAETVLHNYTHTYIYILKLDRRRGCSIETTTRKQSLQDKPYLTATEQS